MKCDLCGAEATMTWLRNGERMVHRHTFNMETGLWTSGEFWIETDE